MPHILYRTPNGQKIIYLLGYGDGARWKKALGGQLGCAMIDEANIADMDFVREVFIRTNYILLTLNPDNPDLPIYAEYINHARPLAQYAAEYPPQLLADLNGEPYEGYTHWFFTFDDNPGLTPEKKAQIIQDAPVGTKLYKNKIQGLRGRATGLVFNLRKRKAV